MPKIIKKAGVSLQGLPAEVDVFVVEFGDITELYDDGTYTYICYAVSGSALTDSVWIVKRVDNSTGSSRWSAINQLATDVSTVAALTYNNGVA